MSSVSLPMESEVRLSDKEFNLLRKFIFEHTRISLSDHKRALVYSRLAKRLRFHGLKTYQEYYDFLQNHDPDGHERVEMINAITTNKTSFFRESHHFDYLRDTVFPEISADARNGKRTQRLRIWSAGCSTGQEPYTIAITVREFFRNSHDWDINILATDIDTNVLQRARDGVYRDDQIQDVSNRLLQSYFLRGKGDKRGMVKISDDLKSLISFQHLNLFDPSWPMKDPLDIIFCRNVIIYFNKETQYKLINRMTQNLKPGGYIILGHSESLHGLENGLVHVKKNVYRYLG